MLALCAGNIQANAAARHQSKGKRSVAYEAAIGRISKSLM